MLKFDLHIHSHYSFDSLTKPQTIAEQAIKKGLDGIAITDHNVFKIDWGKLQSKYPELIIIRGTEIGTSGVGDILCYFITNAITSKDPFEVIKQTHEQGGFTVLAHPFHHNRIRESYPDKLMKLLDAVETGNSHNIINQKQAIKLANDYSKPCTGGSDAHFPNEIGNGLTLIDISHDEALNIKNLKKALLKGIVQKCTSTPIGVKSSFYLSQAIKYARRFKMLKSHI